MCVVEEELRSHTDTQAPAEGHQKGGRSVGVFLATTTTSTTTTKKKNEGRNNNKK